MPTRDLTVRLLGDTGDFDRKMKSAASSAAVFERELARTEAKAAQFKQQLGTGLVAAGTVMAAMVGTTIKKFAEFDAAMSGVQAATHESAAAMDQLRAAALEAGERTAFSATEAAAGIEALAKAGVSTESILNGGLNGALDLAAAGSLDVGQAAEIAATAMTQFKLSGDQVPHVADLLAAAAGKAQGEVTDMGAALSQSGLVAAQVGLSIEETTAALASFASAGLIGSDAGTSLKTMLQRLTPQSDEAAEAMREIGFSAYDANGNFIGLEAVAANLQRGLGGLTAEQRNATLATIFGSDAVRAASVLYEQGAQGVAEWTAKVNDAGFAQETAAIKLDNLKGDWEAFMGALDSAFIKTGSHGNDFARATVQGATDIINAYNGLPESVQASVLALLGIGSAAGIAGGGLLLLLPRIAATKAALDTLGVSAARATAALRTVGTAFAVVAAAAVASELMQYAAGASVATVETDKLTESLLKSARAGELTGGILDLFTVGMGPFQREAETSAEALDRFAISAASALSDNWIDWLERMGTGGAALAGFRKETEQIDAALAKLVAGGHADEAARSFDLFAEAAEREGVSVDKLREMFPQYAEAVTAAKQATEEARGPAQQFAADLGLAGDQADAAAAKFEGLAKRLGMTVEELQKWHESLVETIANFITPLDAYTGKLKEKEEAERTTAEATAAATKDSKDSWEDYAKSVTVSVDEYLAELEKQVVAQQEWATNMLILSSRVSTGTLQELARMGPEGAPLVQKLVSASDREIRKLEGLFSARTKSGTDAMAQTLTEAGPVLARVTAISGEKTAAAYARKLAEGRVTVAQIASEYGIDLENINTAAGRSKRGFDHLRGAIVAVPDAIRVRTTTPGMNAAQRETDNLARKINALKNKSVNVSVSYDSRHGVTVQRGNFAGRVTERAFGGYISGPGSETSDDIPAWLSNGEYVVRAAAVRKYGTALFDALNAGRYADGGLVERSLRLVTRSQGMQRSVDNLMSAIESGALRRARANAAAPGGGDLGGMGYQRQMAVLRQVFPGLALISGFRPGAITATGKPSFHGVGRAVDIPPRMDVFNWIRSNYGRNSKELIFSPAGGRQIYFGRDYTFTGVTRRNHWDHIHWAYNRGGLVGRALPTTRVFPAPRPVGGLTPGQSAGLTRLADAIERGGVGGPLVNIGQLVAADPHEGFRQARAFARDAVAMHGVAAVARGG